MQKKILFINNKTERCGVADYGRRLFSIIKDHFDITYCDGKPDLTGYDIALYNYHHATMPGIKCNNKSVKHIALFHEAFQNITPDTWIPVSELPRPLFSGFKPRCTRSWEIPIIGSFGFGFSDKNFPAIAKMVKREFEQAVLRLNIPFAEFGDADGSMARNISAQCAEILTGTEIKIQITHDFLSHDQLLSWLQMNDLNIFLYDQTMRPGLASAPDYALSVRRPLAISNSQMFRHLPSSICVDNISLPRLIAKGIEPLKQVYEDNSNEKLVEKIKAYL